MECLPENSGAIITVTIKQCIITCEIRENAGKRKNMESDGNDAGSYSIEETS